MRSNSGSGKSTNNNHDPTLRDHEGKKGPAQVSDSEMSGESFDIAGNAKVRGEDPSPSARDRGEVSSKESPGG